MARVFVPPYKEIVKPSDIVDNYRATRTKPVSKTTRDMEERLAETLHSNSRNFLEGLTEDERRLAVTIMREMAESNNLDSSTLKALWEIDYWQKPVTIEQFLEDEYYAGKLTEELFPCWHKVLRTLFAPGSKYTELICGGAIGTGKTTVAAVGMAYLLHRGGCLRDPHQFYGLMKGSNIVYGIYSVTKSQVMDALYSKVRLFVDSIPWFQEKFPCNDKLTSSIQFEKTDMAVKIGSRGFHAMGQDVLAFALDEASFFSAAQGKKTETSDDPTEGMKIYSEAKTRIKSRFLKMGGEGATAGMTFLISSKRSQAAFLEKHIEDSRDDIAKQTTMLCEFNQWEVRDQRKYTMPKFRVEIGDRIFPSRLLTKDESPRNGAQVVVVPGEYRAEFERDIEKSIRDLAGIATFGISNLFRDKSCILKACTDELHHPFTREEIVISTDTDEQIHSYFQPEKLFNIQRSAYRLKRHPQAPRYWHADLALTRDSANITIAHVGEIRQIPRRRADGTMFMDRQPLVEVDLTLRINPPPSGQIDFSKIRTFLFSLRDMGMPLVLGSADQYQSADFLQIMEAQGFEVRHLSVDRDDEAYKMLRQGYQEDRIRHYKYPRLIKELSELEHDVDKEKVDHPKDTGATDEKGTKLVGKDVADGLCFAKGTLIPLLNGTEVPIEEYKGQYLYTCQDNGRVTFRKGSPAFLSGVKKTVIVTLDNGATICCTPEHPFMLRDGSYKEAGTLAPGQSLMPLYRDVSKANPKHGLDGYEKLLDNGTGKWSYTHQRVARDCLNFHYRNTVEGRKVTHHVDFNKRNNDPENLRIMDWDAHQKLHNLQSRRNMQKLWRDPSFVANNKKRASALGKITGPINIKLAQTKEVHEKLRESGHYRRLAKANFSKAWEKLKSDPVKYAAYCRRVSDRCKRKDVTISGLKKAWKEFPNQAHVELVMKCGEKVIDRVIKEAGLTRSQVFTGPSKMMGRPGMYRRDVNYRRMCALAPTCSTMKELYAKMNTSQEAARRALKDAGVTSIQFGKMFFERHRKSYKGDGILHRNHKVVSVKDGPITEVYDITVPEEHNFALSAGVFVHNCGAYYHCCTDARATKSAESVLPKIRGRSSVDAGTKIRTVVGDISWGAVDHDRLTVRRSRGQYK